MFRQGIKRLCVGALLLILTSHYGIAAENVIFMRHALAPGFGDPAAFSLDDCTTQRNLNDEGREQAEKIGTLLKSKGIVPTRILSSPWCRCRETADRLNLGSWQTHDGLSSFFEGHVDRDETIALLLEELNKIDDDEVWLLVTHQVVIQAVTGRTVQSGGIVSYDPRTKHSTLLNLQ